MFTKTAEVLSRAGVLVSNLVDVRRELFRPIVEAEITTETDVLFTSTPLVCDGDGVATTSVSFALTVTLRNTPLDVSAGAVILGVEKAVTFVKILLNVPVENTDCVCVTFITEVKMGCVSFTETLAD